MKDEEYRRNFASTTWHPDGMTGSEKRTRARALAPVLAITLRVSSPPWFLLGPLCPTHPSATARAVTVAGVHGGWAVHTTPTHCSGFRLPDATLPPPSTVPGAASMPQPPLPRAMLAETQWPPFD